MMLGINGRFLSARLTGVQRFAHGLSRALVERSDAVLFLPADAPSPDVPEHVRLIRGVLRGHAWEQLELPRMVKAARVAPLFNPANSAPWHGARHALVVHDILPLTHPQWYARRYAFFQKQALPAALARASHVFTTTECTARQIENVRGVTRQRVHVITQGLEPFQAPAPATAVAELRTRLGLEGPYFLFVGLGDPRKNFELLVSALSELQSAHHFTLLAVGKRTSRIHRRSPELTSAPWLRVLEHVTDADLRTLYSGTLALCFPSLTEGFGRPPLEALACGAPALVGNYPAARELFGACVPILPYEIRSWVEQLQRLLNDPLERPRLAQRGAAVIGGFTWDIAAQQVLDVLQSEAWPGRPVVA
jgi:glycosyltransferase involved in cell wall biosynthesis